MKLRHATASDVAEMFDRFRSVSLSGKDLKGSSIPKSGFYEYHLSFDQFALRVESPLSMVCADAKGIAAYMISYDLDYAREQFKGENQDSVVAALVGLDEKVVYHDQLFLRPGLPLFIAARLWQTADFVAQNEGAPGVVAAVPQKPWKNSRSTHLTMYQGFARRGEVVEENVTLGLFTKPFLEFDTPFDVLETRLIPR